MSFISSIFLWFIPLISIPLIFLISLFFLKKIRKFLSSDLDKQILGIILYKFFGLIYGCIFSYFVFSTILYGIERFNIFDNLHLWLIQNSLILEIVFNTNLEIYNFFNPNEI